ncbi:hypothetical protein [Algiphilus aromaticivorans]|uniref:hypothetical protein n=1 Tax=Algiphilus aromaticivorans TaxID=382454 RepID=UPI000694A2E0|nr:hypothetical protein [Algiphilus aromaticivorans]
MANIDALDFQNPGSIPHGGTYGNQSVLVREITLDAQASIADVLRFARLQGDVRIIDAILFTDTNAASATLDLGYKTVDSGATDDVDHFLAAEDVATAGMFRANAGNPPVVVPSEFDLVATVGGAAISAGLKATVVLFYEFIGH